MGYTHYFTQKRELTPDEFASIGAAVKRSIAKAKGVKIVREYDLPKEPPEINADLIAFNGPGEQGCETFWLQRENSGWQFCKTSREPYDVVVVAALAACHHFAASAFKIDSDGDPEDWEAGVELCSRAIAAPVSNPISSAN
jgi:hypothetical protein